MTKVTKKEFLDDPTGAKFTDVVNNPKIDFQAWLDFFGNPTRQQRMEDSEVHHLRPALAGVIRELENTPCFEEYLKKPDSQRGRQAIGVLVRMTMAKRGWKSTGRKGSLGQRITSTNIDKRSENPVNTSGLSKWFKKAEHYKPFK